LFSHVYVLDQLVLIVKARVCTHDLFVFWFALFLPRQIMTMQQELQAKTADAAKAAAQDALKGVMA